MRIFQPTIPLLTSLPATPVDEQLICFQPIAGAVQLLRYNLATTSWVSVDGKSAYRAFGYRNGAHNGTNAGTGWVGLFQDTNVYDPAACMSASGYTCKVAGRYQVTGQAVYTAWTVASGVAIYKNSALYLKGAVNANSGFATAVVPAAVNDVLAIYVFHNTGASALSAFTAGENWMQVELLDYL